jgi:cytochrome oxidase Cu insertion factor (SCO1/SenC/PrrC family)
MLKVNRIALLAGTGLLASSLVWPSVAMAGSKVAQPPASVGVAVALALPASVKDAHFVDQNGRPQTLGGLKGKTVFIVPLLTLCMDTCPFTTGNLIQLQSRLDAAKMKNVEVVAVDVDPYRDTLKRIKAYVKVAGANFQLWTETGPTSLPKAPHSFGFGTGDRNANLTAIEKFFGWTVEVAAEMTPPNRDWMAPYEKLTYDINHSDGFWVVNANQQVRFVSGTKPAFTGVLSKALATFMGYKSNIYKSAVYKGGWTAPEATQAIEWVMQSKM